MEECLALSQSGEPMLAEESELPVAEDALKTSWNLVPAANVLCPVVPVGEQ